MLRRIRCIKYSMKSGDQRRLENQRAATPCQGTQELSLSFSLDGEQTRGKARGKRMSVVAPGVDVSTWPVGGTFRFPPTNPRFFPRFSPS